MNKKFLAIVLLGLFFTLSPISAHEIELSQVVADNSIAIPKKSNFILDIFKSIFKKSNPKSNVAGASSFVREVKSEEIVSSQSTIEYPNTNTKGAEYLNRYNHEALKDGIQYNSKSFFSSKKLKDRSLEALTITLNERKKLLLEMIKTNPKVLGSYALPLLTRSLMPASLQGLYETQKTITGNVRVFQKDDFINPEKSKIEYHIISNNKKYSFYSIKPVNIQSGDNITVSAINLDDILVGDLISVNSTRREVEENVEEEINSERILNTGELDENRLLPTNHNLLVMMLQYNDAPPPPFTAVQAYDYIFQGQFQNFYKEQSYNKIQFVGDVYGWDTINHSTGGCDNPTIGWGGEIDPFIQSHGINLANYEHILVLTNCANGFMNASSYIGKSMTHINGTDYNISVSWVNGSGTNFLQDSIWAQGFTIPFPWTSLDFVVSHEIGHALGLWHANGIDCGSNSISNLVGNSNCTHMEYGNSYDAMGYGTGYAFHFNAFYKEKLGWFTSSNTITASATGSYTLVKYQNGTGKRYLRVKQLGTTLKPYYVEWRGGGYGFDKGLNNALVSSNKNGLIITNAYSDSIPPYYLSRLIDTRANNNPWAVDVKGVSLNSTSIFSDPRRGITIGPITNKTTSSITFNVTVNPVSCVHIAPIFMYPESYALTATPQAQFILNPTIRNENYTGCSSSNFITSMTLPAGFTSSTTTYNTNALASETDISFLTSIITVGANVTLGTHMIGFTVSEVGGGQTSISVPITIVSL